MGLWHFKKGLKHRGGHPSQEAAPIKTRDSQQQPFVAVGADFHEAPTELKPHKPKVKKGAIHVHL